MIKINVLLAEDNPLNLQLTERLLKKLDASVVCATNGLEALEAFKHSDEGDFKVLFIDVEMPVMDGIETIKSIRNLNRVDAKKVPIYILSGDSYEITDSIFKNLNITDTLSKPIDYKYLKSIITKLKN